MLMKSDISLPHIILESLFSPKSPQITDIKGPESTRITILWRLMFTQLWAAKLTFYFNSLNYLNFYVFNIQMQYARYDCRPGNKFKSKIIYIRSALYDEIQHNFMKKKDSTVN